MNEAVDHRGVLAWFVDNKVAANLLMVLVLVGGAIAMMRTKQEVFPEIDTGIVTVQVPYLGGTPEDVEEAVVKRIEEAVAGIDGVRRVRATAVEGLGTVIIEMEDHADSARVLDDVQSAVDRIETFPKETEKPVVSKKTNRVQVISVVLYGDVPERTLKELAEHTRDDLTKLDNISTIELGGVRRYEVAIEVSEEALRKYGLSFSQVSEAVSRSSLDLPGGEVKTEGGQVLIRTKAQRYTGKDFDDVIVLSRPDGSTIRLNQVAKVIDGFEDSQIVSYFDGQRAAILNVFRVGEQDAIDVADTVRRYVDDVRSTLPTGVSIDTWADQSVFLRQRIDLLTNDTLFGLVLVFLALSLFIDLRLAFWTTVGIPVSFLGAFWLMPLFDVTINMVSLFAFIVVLGIVVDDAIVIGENIFEHRQRGIDPDSAAILGVREMARPVTFAILNTMVAFLPIMFTGGEIGKIMKVIPIIAISVLLVSLVEALIILPSHLAGHPDPRGRKRGPIARVQRRVRFGLTVFIHRAYKPTVRAAVRCRYLTVAIGVVILAVTVGFVFGGYIKFVFFPKIDADNVIALVEMPQGTPVEQTREVVRRVEAAAERVRQSYDLASSPGEPSIVTHANATIGVQPFGRLVRNEGVVGSLEGGASHLGEVNVELRSSVDRLTPSSEFAARWRDEAGQIPGVTSLVFSSQLMSAGEPIHIELAAADDSVVAFEHLLAAVALIKQRLSTYVGVHDIDDSFQPGKQELKIDLKDTGRNLGLTKSDLATQIRQGFYGDEAQRVQRGRDDVKVMVRYPDAERRSLANLENMRIRLPDGAEVPFNTVAQVKTGRGYAAVNRADKRRVISITADVDTAVTTANQINGDLQAAVLPEILADFPGVSWRFEGAQREQGESMESLEVNFVLALLGIFALLGIQFRSYTQPFIVMSVIPFGLVGAVIGHALLGFDLSFLSGFGVVALTGVVVNDSLILIEMINNYRGRGHPLRRVVTDAGVRRFPAIMLTTVTTFVGLIPILSETSIQARFLVPMAISLAFGVVFATMITLLLVPALYVIQEDLQRLLVAGKPVDVDRVNAAAEAQYAAQHAIQEAIDRGQPIPHPAEFSPVGAVADPRGPAVAAD